MAELFVDLAPSTQYWDKKSGLTRDQYVRRMNETSTVYVGNLSFYTTEEQIYELFNKVGEVGRVVMGLNRVKRTPCGFCFVEFFSHEAAGLAVNLLTHTVLDDRVIRVDWDAGFIEGRQYGRGQSGDQWRDVLSQEGQPVGWVWYENLFNDVSFRIDQDKLTHKHTRPEPHLDPASVATIIGEWHTAAAQHMREGLMPA